MITLELQIRLILIDIMLTVHVRMKVYIAQDIMIKCNNAQRL